MPRLRHLRCCDRVGREVCPSFLERGSAFRKGQAHWTNVGMEFQLNKSVCLKPATGRQSQLSDGNAAGETESCDSSTQSVRVESAWQATSMWSGVSSRGGRISPQSCFLRANSNSAPLLKCPPQEVAGTAVPLGRLGAGKGAGGGGGKQGFPTGIRGSLERLGSRVRRARGPLSRLGWHQPEAQPR